MIASKPINWTRPLILIPNTMLKWYKNYTYLFYRKQSIFILWWGAGWEWWNDSDSKCEIFIFRSSFYAIIDQHEILDKEIPNLVIHKNSWFTITLNSVPGGYIAEAAYGIYQAKNWVLLMPKLLIKTEFLVKKDPICTFKKKKKKSYLALANKTHKRLLDHKLRNIHF